MELKLLSLISLQPELI